MLPHWQISGLSSLPWKFLKPLQPARPLFMERQEPRKGGYEQMFVATMAPTTPREGYYAPHTQRTHRQIM